MKLVIFDVDGTLVDSQDVIFSAMSSGIEQAGLPPMSRQEVLSIVGLSLPVAVETLLPHAPETTRQTVVDGYRTDFRAAKGRVGAPLFPGIRDLLQDLSRRDDLILGIATGKSRRGLDAMLASQDLAKFFTTIQCADGHPSKPNPEMLFSAARAVGIDPANAVMIGDTTFDMTMAVNAGMTGIGVSWGYHPVDTLRDAGAVGIADTVPDLRTLIESWAA